MWQPNHKQWSIIWGVALLTVVAWPPGQGRSLVMKVVNWSADPNGSLPRLPGPLPMSLDDDGDAVAAHDARETEYYRYYESSATARWRLKMKVAADPFDQSTQRQLLAGVAVFAILAVWRMDRL
jgi:hypothetical protein